MDAFQALMSAHKETKDLIRKSEYFLVFLDRLERLGEEALVSNGSRDDQVPMDVDPTCEAAENGRCVPINLEYESR
jgi:hypothetical protein